MKDFPSYYEILQVSPSSSFSVIRDQYRRVMLSILRHPQCAEMKKYALLFNEAYEILSNPNSRAVYDQLLNQHQRLWLNEAKLNDQQLKKEFGLHHCRHCYYPHGFDYERDPAANCPQCAQPLFAPDRPALKHAHRILNRMPKNDPVIYYVTWPGTSYAGELFDVSPQGIGFYGYERLPLQHVIQIDAKFLHGTARVTHVRFGSYIQHSPLQYIIGAAFIQIDFDDTQGNFISKSV